MKTSESISKIIPALLKAQKNIGAAIKGSENPFFKSKYADLGTVMEACKAPLNDQGIVVIQSPSLRINEVSGESENIMETLLVHESGEFVQGEMKLILDKKDMQKLGSSISYAKRYILQALTFIPSQDDDSEGSMNRPKKKDFKKPASGGFSKSKAGAF